jgi:phosphoglycerate dehydrogenase-like enzyme
VQAVTAGTDTFDVAALAEMGVSVANNGGGNSVAVAEHTIALMVAVFRNLRAQFDATRVGEWAAQLAPRVWPNAFELSGRTVGIVGAGNIGRQLAERLQGWDCRLIYHDIQEVPPELSARLGLERVTLDALLHTADVVTLHVPLTAETRAMIGERELGLLKPTAVLINTCRGPVLDEAALVDALRAGRLAGAALDVLENEQNVAGNPLLDMDNVVVTPHTAGMAMEAVHKSVVFALTNAARVVAGEPPQSVVLPE